MIFRHPNQVVFLGTAMALFAGVASTLPSFAAIDRYNNCGTYSANIDQFLSHDLSEGEGFVLPDVSERTMTENEIEAPSRRTVHAVATITSSGPRAFVFIDDEPNADDEILWTTSGGTHATAQIVEVGRVPFNIDIED